MSDFVTFDINGYLDHVVFPNTEAKTLGFRSCLYKHEGVWLFGAQALAAARKERAQTPLRDAIDALANAAGKGNIDSETSQALPSALWQLAMDTFKSTESVPHLAVVIPDGRYLGSQAVSKATGKTTLETLYYAFVNARPSTLRLSRIEFVWRSVATARAILDRGSLGSEPGSILVIGVNRRVFWTTLELRLWTRDDNSEKPLRIVRKPVSCDCDETESWIHSKVESVRSALAKQGRHDLDAVYHWTRYLETASSGLSENSLAKIGLPPNALENRSWPTLKGTWGIMQGSLPDWFHQGSLPVKLKKRISEFCNGQEGKPLGIVIENPAGSEMTADFEALVKRLANEEIEIFRVTGPETTLAAQNLARDLNDETKRPAWLDEVPQIELKVKTRIDDQTTDTNWLPIIDANEAIPAGETYHTRPNEGRRVTLAPGIEHIHLHLRRGDGRIWDERFSGRDTGHSIQPSDHVRIVEPLARVRPLSGEARIEIVEHLVDGSVQALESSEVSIRWSEMGKNEPENFRSIPELYVFEASQTCWNELKPLLGKLIDSTPGPARNQLRSDIYECTQSQWRKNVFPLGSDGLPPRTGDPDKFVSDRKLLRSATEIMLDDLEESETKQLNLKPKIANRLHMPLTWLFTGCPSEVGKFLLRIVLQTDCKSARNLHFDNIYSSWAIYQGLGRAAQDKETFRTIFDRLIEKWEQGGGLNQDKYLLAAVTHPMARRVSVRDVLNEDQSRLDRVRRFLDRHLQNILEKNHDPRPKNEQPDLELRYVSMGYRGLCQVRYSNPDWYPTDGTYAIEAYENLCLASKRASGSFTKVLVDLTAPYLIGEGMNPTMPGGF